MKKAVSITMAIFLLLLAAFLVVVLVLGIQGRMFSFNGNWMKLRHTEAISLGNQDTLKIDVRSYSVVIKKVGATEEPRIEVYSLPWGNFASNEVEIASGDNTLSIKQTSSFTFSFLGGSYRQLRLYLPEGWQGTLLAEQGSGSLSLNDNFDLNKLTATVQSGSIRVENVTVKEDAVLSSNSGSIRANSLTAKNISVKASSGSIRVETAVANTIDVYAASGSIHIGTVNGQFSLQSSSGSISVDAGNGGGSVRANSGSVRVYMNEVTNDLSLSAGSGSVRLYLPSNIGFSFEGQTGSGSLKTDFDSSLSYNGRNYASGQVGNGGPSIQCTAGSGSVHVELGI